MNNVIKTIKLGAPSIIEGGASPEVTLSVQNMTACTNVILNDEGNKCTSNGALRTALNLYAQLESQLDAPDTEGYEIQIKSGNDAVTDGGTMQLVLKYDSDEVTTPVVWSIKDADVVEGDTPSIDKNGNLTINQNSTGVVVVCVFSFDGDIKSSIKIGYVAGMCTKEPRLAALVKEFPQMVNSLVNTGITNYLCSDGIAYIDLDYSAGSETELEVLGRFTSDPTPSTWPGLVGACDSGETNRFSIRRHSSNNIFQGQLYTTIHEVGIVKANKNTHLFKLGKNGFSCDDILVRRKVLNTFRTKNKLSLFRDNNINQSAGRITSCDISYCKVQEGDIYIHCVPFCREGACGMMDLGSDFGRFYVKSSSSGNFSIKIEK